MYSTARKLAATCFVLAIINIVASIMVVLLLLGLDLEFYAFFAIVLYLLSVTFGLLLLAVALRNLLQDADAESESTALRFKKLTDRVKELEKNIL